MCLYELTDHAAGIIVFENDSVIVANWESMYAEQDDAMPAVFYGDLIWTKHEGIFDDAEVKRFTNILKELPEEMTVEYDYNNDIKQLLSQEEKESGEVYTLKDGTRIFTLDSWC